MTESQASEGWIELFPGEEWNRFPSEQTEQFSGRLVFTREGDVPSIYMRFNPFKLITAGGEAVDVHGNDEAALLPYTDRDVIIQGKLVDVSLEGATLVEIWPTRIRVR